ncbi:hypothetical protein ABW19_dt0200256 [Dactylella cylindrospora]|nr:hypothetical protein ABW19_dt0200256 [Dactylella cylindrospora]
MLLKARFTLLRKIFLLGVFGIGIFSMIACLFARLALILWQLSKTPGDATFNKDWTVWMAREVSSAVIVGNVYYLAPAVKILEEWVSRWKAKKAAVQLEDSPEIGRTLPIDEECPQGSIVPIGTQGAIESRKDDEPDPAYVTVHNVEGR